MSEDKHGTVRITDRSGIGCGMVVLGICLLFILTSDKFWAGLRMVVEAWR